MSQQYKHYKKPKPKPLIFVLLFITAVALGITAWAVFFRQPEKSILAPDYAPQELEENAEDMEDSGREKLESEEGGGAVSIEFQTEAVVSLSTGRVALSYGNPQESNQDVLLQVVVQDTLIAQSGRLTPGHSVSSLALAEGVAEQLQPGGYDGKFVVTFYDPATSEKAALNTEIPLHITVIE